MRAFLRLTALILFLSLALAPVTYLLLLGLVERRSFATVWAGSLLGATFLTAIVVLGRCPAGAEELQKQRFQREFTAMPQK